MQDDRYKKLTRGTGADIRNLMNLALNDAEDLMGRKALEAELLEILPDDDMEKVRAALATKFRDFAKAGQDRGRRFELRGHIDELVIKTVDGLAAQDRLIAVEDEEEIDAAEIATQIQYGDKIGGHLDRKRDEERAAAQEILRKAEQW